ncbi:MAG: long-chain-fatty-acid--CoA ligase [Acidimicrobiales bacterium]|jgi:acyl-CoA synthetase (AMP-forming)/AMP-acid ligase II|nr:long-chain-fatty-acid--CoA ligase [Acidimicrobiales bacterium]
MRVDQWFSFHAAARPGVPFAVGPAEGISWAEAEVRANRLARALLAAGISPGERIAYVSKNSPAMAVAIVACAKAGIVPVLLNHRLAPPEWSWILDDARCRAVIAQPAFVEALEGIRGELPDVGSWLVTDGEPATGWRSVTEVTAAVADAPLPLAGDDTAVLYQMYTSGTTGRPKGVLTTHRAALTNVAQVQSAQEYRPCAGDRNLVVAPMYHASGAITVVNASLDGLTLVIQPDFDPSAVVDALSDGGVAFCTLVPVMIQLCLAVPGATERDYSSLHAIAYGASPIAVSLLRQALDVFGCEMGQGFGQTEATAALTFLTKADHDAALAGAEHLLRSVGRPLAGTEVRIVDPSTAEPVPVGEIGEITARGPQVMLGYWNAPERTAETLRDGWLHTGDLGYVDAEGYVYVHDRLKDMIVSGGTNVYSAEVENVLFDHPAVAEVAVIAVPDETWGETVCALVVPAAGASAPTLDDLRDFARERLAGYKLPRRLELLDALPRNASGKVQKHVLREPFWAGHDRRVG